MTKPKKSWSKEEIRMLFSLCKFYKDDDKAIEELKKVLLHRSEGSLKIAVTIRYNELNGTNTIWFASNIPKKFREVWLERDWKRKT